MDLMEYQAKELFAKHGVKTTLGVVVTTPEEARAAAEDIPVLEELGVAKVFTPGATTGEITSWVSDAFAEPA